MLYEIRLDSPKLDTTFYPPNLDLDVTINNETGKALPIFVYYAVYLVDANNSFTYWQAISPAPGKTSMKVNLAFEYVAFQRAAIQLKNADGLNINIKGTIVSESGRDITEHSISYTVDKALWVLAMHEDKRPQPTGLKTHYHFAAVLDEKIGDLEKRTANDPILQLQKKVFESQVNMIKEYLLDRPEIKELKGFEPLISICSIVKVNPRWAIAAALLSSFEGYIKKWLVNHAGETYDTLKNKNFDELTAKLRAQLKKDRIEADQTKLAELASIRVYRNLVLHEMHEPKENELETIKLQSRELMNYIESLKPLS